MAIFKCIFKVILLKKFYLLFINYYFLLFDIFTLDYWNTINRIIYREFYSVVQFLPHLSKFFEILSVGWLVYDLLFFG